MSDISGNLEYPIKEWDSLMDMMSNELKIVISQEMLKRNKKDKISFMNKLINESREQLKFNGIDTNL